MEQPEVRVGIAVFIFKDGKFLMMQRKGSHGAGSWSVPGGHLEFGESFEQTAEREVREETGLEISNYRVAGITNDYFESEGKHYVTIWLVTDYASGQEKILEPQKCTGMEWVDFDHLPQPLFLPWNQLLKSEFLDSIKRA